MEKIFRICRNARYMMEIQIKIFKSSFGTWLHFINLRYGTVCSIKYKTCSPCIQNSSEKRLKKSIYIHLIVIVCKRYTASKKSWFFILVKLKSSVLFKLNLFWFCFIFKQFCDFFAREIADFISCELCYLMFQAR